MLRSLFGRPRTIRVPINNGNVNVQEVKMISNPRSRSSNFITTWLFAYVVYRSLESWDALGTDKKSKSISKEYDEWKKKPGVGNNDDALGKHWKEQHAQMQKNGAANSTAIDALGATESNVVQITVPVWLRQQKPVLYTINDPEFKDFARLQADKKKMEILKREVGKAVGERLRNPAHEMNLAYIQFKGNIAVSLDVAPQLYAPPQYEMPCINLTPDSISLGWRTLSPQVGGKIDRVFRPTVLLDASKSAISAFCSASYTITRAKVVDALGISSHSAGAYNPHIGGPPILPTKTTLTMKDLAKDSTIPPPSGWPSNAQTMQELLRAIHNGKMTRQRHQDIVKAMPYSTAVEYAAATFNRSRILGQFTALQQKSRGVVQIRGYVTCLGERGRYRLDVIAYYLPADDAFLGPVTVKGAYVLKDYNQWQKLADAKSKQSLDTQSKAAAPTPASDSAQPSDKEPK